MQIIGSTIKQAKNYKISNFTSMAIALVTLNMSKLQHRDIIGRERNEKNCLLHSFNIQTSEFVLFVFIDKNWLYIHNQLYAIALPNIYYRWIGYIISFSLYILRKKCLKVNLLSKTIL